MSRFRFSLLSLAGGTAAIALGCASLVQASWMLSSIVWGATLLILAFGALCALLVEPQRRGFWVGFALIGWLYVLVVYGPLSGLSKVVSLEPLLNRAAKAMPQAKALNDVTISIDPSAASEGIVLLAEPVADSGEGTMSLDIGFPYSVRARAISNTEFIESFMRIAHALIAILLGISGGVCGYFIRRRYPQPTQPNTAPAT